MVRSGIGGMIFILLGDKCYPFIILIMSMGASPGGFDHLERAPTMFKENFSPRSNTNKAGTYWLVNHCSAEYSLQNAVYMKLAGGQVGRLTLISNY